MAAPKKSKRVEVDEGEYSSNESDNENEEVDEDDGDVDEIIDVDFEAHEPNGGDFDGVKRLLQQLFLKSHVDTSAVTGLIIEQNYIGNVIKQSEIPEDTDDDEQDVTFGVTTVLNITDRQEVPCIQQLRKLLVEHCNLHGSLNCQQIVDKLLKRTSADEHHVGFIINERLVNIPAKIASPTFESLFKDIREAVNRNQRFNFDHYIMVCKVYKLITSKNGSDFQTTIYTKSEEEIFKEEALESFEYSISGEADSGLQGEWDADDEGMAPFHKVLIIQSEKFDSILSQLKTIT